MAFFMPNAFVMMPPGDFMSSRMIRPPTTEREKTRDKIFAKCKSVCKSGKTACKKACKHVLRKEKRKTGKNAVPVLEETDIQQVDVQNINIQQIDTQHAQTERIDNQQVEPQYAEAERIVNKCINNESHATQDQPKEASDQPRTTNNKHNNDKHIEQPITVSDNQSASLCDILKGMKEAMRKITVDKINRDDQHERLLEPMDSNEYPANLSGAVQDLKAKLDAMAVKLPVDEPSASTLARELIVATPASADSPANATTPAHKHRPRDIKVEPAKKEMNNEARPRICRQAKRSRSCPSLSAANKAAKLEAYAEEMKAWDAQCLRRKNGARHRPQRCIGMRIDSKWLWAPTKETVVSNEDQVCCSDNLISTDVMETAQAPVGNIPPAKFEHAPSTDVELEQAQTIYKVGLDDVKVDETDGSELYAASTSIVSISVADNLPSSEASSPNMAQSSTSLSDVDETDQDAADDEDEEDEEAKRRALWGPIQDLKTSMIKDLTRRFMDRSPDEITSVRWVAGLNNTVYIVEYNSVPEICIRIPACGWGEHYTNNDRRALKHTVDMMRFLSNNTSMPIPKVLHCNLEMANEINAPYIAMEFINGASPAAVWFGNGAEDGDMVWVKKYTGEVVDDPADTDDECVPGFRPMSPHLEQKRQTMLKSLAYHCAELRKFTFNQYGSPQFENGRIVGIGPRHGESLGVVARSNQSADCASKVEQPAPQSDMRAYLHERLGVWDDMMRHWLEDDADDDEIGVKVLNYRLKKHLGYTNFAHLVIHVLHDGLPSKNAHLRTIGQVNSGDVPAEAMLSTAETFDPDRIDEQISDISEASSATLGSFVLMPPDFGSRNLICDPETGAITAMIDWDNTNTEPRYMGWSSCFDVLLHDWWGEGYFNYPFEGYTMHAEEYDRYRADYARYLREACEADGNIYGVDDWKWTRNGAIIENLVEAIREHKNHKDLYEAVDKLLATVLPRVDENKFMKDVMAEWMDPGLHGMLELRLKRFFGLVTDEEVRGLI